MTDINIELIEIENFSTGMNTKKIDAYVNNHLTTILKPWRDELISIKARLERLEFIIPRKDMETKT
jgi:hypothetical protein